MKNVVIFFFCSALARDFLLLLATLLQNDCRTSWYFFSAVNSRETSFIYFSRLFCRMIVERRDNFVFCSALARDFPHLLLATFLQNDYRTSWYFFTAKTRERLTSPFWPKSSFTSKPSKPASQINPGFQYGDDSASVPVSLFKIWF